MAVLVSVILVVVLASLLVTLVLLTAFASASRRDALFLQPSSTQTRWARRVTGMYTRGNDDELIGR
ncbi:hypothetical protein [Actinomadura hibisca]|uniref:hypothetical protein n=1 Tax=Actinomadura hibisca TaxID=68565 RepID=UPI000AF36DEE|nr:hypothetical protein [Actinomadura hibisca]